MCSILCKSFWLSQNCVFSVGLVKEGSYLNVRFGISKCSAQVSLSHDELRAFTAKRRDFGKFFRGRTFNVNCRLKHHSILLLKGKEGELVLKSKIMWNSVKINSGEFENLMDFVPIAEKHMELCLTRKQYLEFQMSLLSLRVKQNICANASEAIELYKKATSENLMVPQPPPLSLKEIQMELRSLIAVESETEICELLLVFGNDLTQEILKSLNFIQNDVIVPHNVNKSEVIKFNQELDEDIPC